LAARVPIIITSRVESAEAQLASCDVAAAFVLWLKTDQKIKESVSV
jgi:hypothetical protein